jgi:hypothetical protein
MKRLMNFVAAALLASGLFATPASAETGGWFGGNVEVPDRQGDAIVAGGAVTIAGRVAGDAMIAAGQARVNGDVLGDARVASGEYRQLGDVSGELAIAAGKVDIDGSVGDDLYVAAEDVRIGVDTRVGRNARIAGQDVLIKGRVDGDLDVQGENVALSAQIGGDVKVRARSLVLGPDTTIEGKLIWEAAEQPDIPGEAIVAGGVEGKVVRRWNGPSSRSAFFAGEAAARLMMAVSAFLLGLLLVLAAPGTADRAVEAARRAWPAALGWGAALVFVTPLVGLVLLLTIVGIPLGIMALLAYPLLLLVGYASGAMTLGALALGTRGVGRRVLAVAAGIVGLTLLAFLPFLGAIIGVAVTLFGLGVWVVVARERPA